MPITLKDFRQHRSLRRLLDHEILISLLQMPCADPALRQQLGAELIVRCWLFAAGGEAMPAAVPLSRLTAGLQLLDIPTEQITAACTWCRQQSTRRSLLLPEPLASAESVLWRLVRYDLENWRTAQGIVLFVPTTSAPQAGFSRTGIALPFTLDDSTSNTRAEPVRYADDTPVGDDALNRAVCCAHRLATARQWLKGATPAVKLTTLRSSTVPCPIIGESLGMAALLAMALRAHAFDNCEFPVIGTSGIISDNGCLVPMAHCDNSLLQKEQLLCAMGVPYRLLPAGPQYNRTDTITLPEINCADFLQEKISAIAASLSKTSTTTPLSLLDIENRLGKIQQGMRYGSIGATEAKETCEMLLAKLHGQTSVRAVDLQISATANLAAAQCHLGDPQRSDELCRSIIANRAGGSRYRMQAMIRQVVNLTDMCRYSDAVDTAQQASTLLEHMASHKERHDMELQLTGSKGQAMCYWALLDPARTEPTLITLQHAADLARELDTDCPTDTADLPRNLCYLYLAHALLKPTAAEQVFHQVHAACMADTATCEFFRRARWLNAYRLLLLRLELPPDLARLDMAMPSATAAGGWLHQTAAKYRGALRAAQGDADGACADFATAARLTDDGERYPLMEFIGATACLQAGASLAALRPQESSAYLQRAAAIFRKRQHWFSGELSGSRWLQHAETIAAAGANADASGSAQRFYPY